MAPKKTIKEENEDKQLSDKQQVKSDEAPHPNATKITLYTYIVVGICQASFFVYVSLVPYLTKQYGLDTLTFGYLQSGCALLQFCLSPLVGRFGDKYGARAVLILSALSTMTGHFTLGIASSASWLVVSRLSTLVQDIRLGADMMVTDITPAGPARGVAMGKVRIPMALALFLAPPVAGQLSGLLGSQGTLLVTALGPLSCVGLLLATVPANTKRGPTGPTEAKTAASQGSLLAAVSSRPVLLLLTTKLLTAVPFMTLAQNLGLIGMTVFGLSPQMNGLLLSFNGILGVVINAVLLGRLTKTFSEDKLFRAAPIMMTIAYGLLSQATSVWYLPVICVPWNLGSAILDNQIVARLTAVAPGGKTGSMVGLNASMFQLSRIAAPLLGGYLLQNLGFQAIGYFGTAVSILSATLLNVAL